MKNFTLLIDMDDIIVACQRQMLDDYNKARGADLTIDDLISWDFKSNLPAGEADWHKDVGFFENLKPLPGALEALEYLNNKYTVMMLSSPSQTAESASEKVRWIAKYMPFLPYRNYILTKHKYLVRGDVFIDDAPKNLFAYREAWPDATILTIAYPYNKDAIEVVNGRFQSCRDTRFAWGQMVGIIDATAQTGRCPLKAPCQVERERPPSMTSITHTLPGLPPYINLETSKAWPFPEKEVSSYR